MTAKDSKPEPVTGEVSGPVEGESFPIIAGTVEERFPTPRLASEAAHEAAKRPKEEDLTLILTCGDFGGRTRQVIKTEGDDGETIEEIIEDSCDHPSSFGVPGSRYGVTPGRCFKHTESKLAEKERRKALFLDHYCQHPSDGIDGAAEAIGLDSPSTIYWWARHDKGFRENMESLVTLAEAMRNDRAETVMMKRINDPTINCDNLRQWYFMNRRPDRWKNPKGPQGEGGGGGATVVGGNHVWLIGDEHQKWGR